MPINSFVVSSQCRLFRIPPLRERHSLPQKETCTLFTVLSTSINIRKLPVKFTASCMSKCVRVVWYPPSVWWTEILLFSLIDSSTLASRFSYLLNHLVEYPLYIQTLRAVYILLNAISVEKIYNLAAAVTVGCAPFVVELVRFLVILEKRNDNWGCYPSML